MSRRLQTPSVHALLDAAERRLRAGFGERLLHDRFAIDRHFGQMGIFGGGLNPLRAADEAVKLYNCRRPHQALGYTTPMAVHVAA